MKMKPIVFFISALSCSTFIHAGTMGAAEAPAPISSFLSVEGGYTWNQIGNNRFTITGIPGDLHSKESNNGGTGRIGAGLMRRINDNIGLSGEIGYGYYGKTTSGAASALAEILTSIDTRADISNTITGFDALAGIAYINPEYNYNLYFKVGAMIQNVNIKNTLHGDIGALVSRAPAVRVIFSSTQTAALPELKVGGGYSLNSNWSLTASYLRVFGSSPSVNGNVNMSGNRVFDISFNSKNPTINTALLGIQYSI